ncbi:MAG: CoA-binding protein [Candidatus Paceibacterota bacterium]|jgi:acetyltransferase|nr:CoA-binding protein [bacterium]
MSILKTFDNIFDPKTVAIVGASEEKGTVGFGLASNLIKGSKKRNIYFVNPFDKEIFGEQAYDKVTDIKGKIDLVVIAVPAKIVLQIVKDCISKKVGGVIIVSSGFGELGEDGKKKENEIVKLLRTAKIPLIGPNCLGVLNSRVDFNASFAPISPLKGNIAFLSQSGALLNSLMDTMNAQGLGFSKLVSYGNEADLDLSDFLLYLKDDKDTKVICLYIEGIKDGHKFMEIAKEVTLKKPILVIKSGRSSAGQKAAATHTGSIAGDYQVYETAFKQSGVVLVETLEDLFDSAKALVMQPRCTNGIGIVTNGGGAGVLTVDYCDIEGVVLPEINEEDIKKIDKRGVLNSIPVKRNPLDLIGDALPDRYCAGINAFLAQEKIQGLIVIETTQIMTEPLENAKIIIEMKKKYPKKPIVCCFLGGDLVVEATKLLEKNDIPNYSELRRAVRAIKNLIKNEHE